MHSSVNGVLLEIFWKFFFKSKFSYLHLVELIAQAHTSHCHLLITGFSWFKVLGRHVSRCGTYRLAGSRLLLLLQPLLGSLPPLLTEVSRGLQRWLTTCCSSRGPKFSSQQPHWYLQLQRISPSSGLLTPTYMQHTKIQTNTDILKKCFLSWPVWNPPPLESETTRRWKSNRSEEEQAENKNRGCLWVCTGARNKEERCKFKK